MTWVGRSSLRGGLTSSTLTVPCPRAAGTSRAVARLGGWAVTWNPRNGTSEDAKGLHVRVTWARAAKQFCFGWSRGLACCKWISESFIAKDLEMASSLWVVWSSGVVFPATAEVTQPEPWWSLQMSAWPGLTPSLGSLRPGSQ